MPSDTFPIGARVRYNVEPGGIGRIIDLAFDGFPFVQWDDGTANDCPAAFLTRLPDDAPTPDTPGPTSSRMRR